MKGCDAFREEVLVRAKPEEEAWCAQGPIERYAAVVPGAPAALAEAEFDDRGVQPYLMVDLIAELAGEVEEGRHACVISNMLLLEGGLLRTCVVDDGEVSTSGSGCAVNGVRTNFLTLK